MAMYLPGMGASMIQKVSKFIFHLTPDMMKESTSIDKFKEIVSKKYPNIEFASYIDSVKFTHDGYGPCLIYGSYGPNTPPANHNNWIYKVNNVQKPTRIYLNVGFKDNSCTNWHIHEFVGNTTNTKSVPLLFSDNSSSSSGSSISSAYVGFIVDPNVNTTILSPYIHQFEYDLDIKNYTFTNNFLTDEPDGYMYMYVSPATRSDGNVTSSYVYIHELKIEF